MTYGDGRTFKRGKHWWIAYWVDGVEIREPAGNAVMTEEAAGKRLRARRREAMASEFLSPREQSVRVDDILDDLLTHLRAKGTRSADKVESHLVAVRSALGRRHAVDLTTAQLERYQTDRLEEGKARATVNRELEALRQAYRLAANRTPRKLSPTRVPMVPMLRVENARQGFTSRADFDAILAAFPDRDVADFVEWSYWTAMRPNETRGLTWEGLDRESWTLRLHARNAKIGRGRVLALAGPTLAIIERRLLARRLDCPLIFHRTSRGQAGQPVKDYAKAWRNACRAAGLAAGRSTPGGLIPYDLRRTGIRNMVRAGVDSTVAKRISGHTTDSTFARYNITSEEDIREAFQQTADYVAEQPKADKTRTIPGSTPSRTAPVAAGVAEAGGNRTRQLGPVAVPERRRDRMKGRK